MGFDSEVLLSGIDLYAAEIGPDGEILIDQTSNDELADIFDDNLQIAAKLFNDDDGDGLLDANEREPDDVLAE